MKMHPGLVSTEEQIMHLARTLEQESKIAFDVEFIRESTFFPMIELIQVATKTESWLIDARAFKKTVPEKKERLSFKGILPLLSVFKNPNILKVVHAAQGDQECLYTSFGETASPIFDTALAASLCGYGEGQGLGNLLKNVLGISIKKGHARSHWSLRPLPDELCEYAHFDVIYLVELADVLLKKLEEKKRKDWALQLSSHWENKALYQMNVEGLTEKLARGKKLDKKAASALYQLVQWREKRIRTLNRPRRWVAEDSVLLDLAKTRPQSLSQLSTFRGLSQAELKKSGESILSALKKAEEMSPSVSCLGSGASSASSKEGDTLKFFQFYLTFLAQQHQIAAKHLLTSEQIFLLFKANIEKSEDLKNLGFLSPQVINLIGDEIVEMLQGKKALLIQDQKVQIIDLRSIPIDSLK